MQPSPAHVLDLLVVPRAAQNNLLELHALFDLCCAGLLGTRKSFKQ